MSEMNGDRGPGSGVRDPGSGIRGPGSGVRDPGSGIRGPEDRDTQLLAEVDRELRAALSIAPSADFEARVLQRIEADRPVRVGVFGAGRGLQTPALLAAAASLVLAAGLFYAVNRTPASDPRSPQQVVEHRAPVSSPAPDHAPVATDVAPPRVNITPSRVDAPRTARLTARRPEPEVIVPLNQMEAVRRLVRAVNEGRVEAPAEPPQGPMALPSELAIAPLVVEPIPVRALDPVASEASPEIRRSY
jgi:hypothetical protein